MKQAGKRALTRHRSIIIFMRGRHWLPDSAADADCPNESPLSKSNSSLIILCLNMYHCHSAQNSNRIWKSCYEAKPNMTYLVKLFLAKDHADDAQRPQEQIDDEIRTRTSACARTRAAQEHKILHTARSLGLHSEQYLLCACICRGTV
jgi:hypothetical protein